MFPFFLFYILFQDDEDIKDDLLDDAEVQKDSQNEKTKSNPASPNVRKRKSRKE